MAGNGSFQRDSQEPLGLSLNLSSNNPFRNRAASPGSPFDDPPARPLSRNPFLEQPPPPLKSPGAMSNNSEGAKSLSAEEIFNSLTLDEKKPLDLKFPDPDSQNTSNTARRENVPPSDATNRRNPTPSQEEALRTRKMPPPGLRAGPSASPNRRPPPRPRPRRNSDSSVLDFDNMPLTEEEKQMIARRRERERQRRERPDGQPKEPREKREPRESREPREPRETRENREGKSRSKSGRPNRRVDIIDQLDATGIYGTGLFHHDGPFDALNPHRNRNRARRAPMQAFPKDSLNNSLGGAGPLNKQADHSTFMGQHNDEAFREYGYRNADTPDNDTRGAGSKPRIIDPIARGDAIHGESSVGLGTSTFLEGTPAARTAIVRNREEQQREFVEGGLQRKKSLAQRIRHINKGQREQGSGRVTSPEAVASAGQAEGNPFFSEFGKGEEAFTVRPRDGAMSPNSPPRRGSAGGATLERRATADGAMGSEDGGKPSGFLGRMKSLKGGRRQRRDDSGPASPPGNPGTAI